MTGLVDLLAEKCNHAERGSLENRNLGWHNGNARSRPFSDSASNEEVWALLRRFNKQIFCVRTIDERPLTGLDMNNATVYDTSPERLRAHMERLYFTVVFSAYSFFKHLVRLRSWRERPRTMAYLVVYAFSWHLDLLTPTLTVFLILLILCPAARGTCFPPAPPALINARTGGIQKPLSGELASNSITGAPEKHVGEAIEQEAISFIEGISKLMVSIGSGKHLQCDAHENEWDKAPNPSRIFEGITDARDNAKSTETSGDDDRTRKPINELVQAINILPIMRILPGLLDTWERFGNALSPTPPFPLLHPRMILAASLVPLLLILCFCSWYTIMKSWGFVTGFWLFGDPVIQSCLAFLDRTCAGWRERIELRHNILRGVPTNAQLTITMLRIGEREHDPLPPPPDSDQPSNLETKLEVQSRSLDQLGTSGVEIRRAIDSQPDRDNRENKHERKSKTVRFVADAVRRTTKGGVRTMLKLNQLKAHAGGERAKERLGALEDPKGDKRVGPVRFPARYHGERGYAYITATATTPALSWRLETEALKNAWTLPLADIAKLRKEIGLGWQGKGVVGGIIGQDVAGGMAVTTKKGTEYRLTGIILGDEMFNRLLSMGGHMWEII